MYDYLKMIIQMTYCYDLVSYFVFIFEYFRHFHIKFSINLISYLMSIHHSYKDLHILYNEIHIILSFNLMNISMYLHMLIMFFTNIIIIQFVLDQNQLK